MVELNLGRKNFGLALATECNNAFHRPEDSGQHEPAVCSPDLLNFKCS